MLRPMKWQRLPYWKRGGCLGGSVASIGALGAFIVTAKQLVIDGWPGIVTTAGDQLSNLIGWVLIYLVLSLVVAGVAFVALAALFVPVGSLIGWLSDKAKATFPPTPPPT